MKWPRLFAVNALIFICCLSILFVGGEAYYRFFYDSTDSFGLTLPTQRWFGRHYHSNGSGFRDSIEYAFQKTPGKIRVTFLGDSFTAGHGVADVDKRFANRVRRENPAWEIHVFARNGWDTGDEINMLQTAIDQGYSLDRVVLIYCLNDVADIVPEWSAILERIYAPDKNHLNFLIQRSYLANMLYYRLKAVRDPDISQYYHFVRAAYERLLWEIQQKRLSLLQEMVTAHGGKLLVVTFPFLHAIGPRYEYQEIHKKLDDFWTGLGVPHLDLLSVYEKYPAKQLTINRFDAHPNELAHGLAAQAIGEFLKTHMNEERRSN